MANNPKKSDANDVNNVPEHQSEKAIIFTGVYGKVKWFNVKRGYGFVCRNDTQEDVFIHQSAIVKNNPDHMRKSVGEGEEIQFDIVKGVKGNEAASVCAADGNHVQGSEYALRYMRGGRGRGRGGRGRGGRGRGRSRGPSEEYDNHPNDFGNRGGFQRGGGVPRGGRNFRGGRPYMMQYRKPFPNYDLPPLPPPPLFYEYNNYDYDYFRGPARGRGGPMRGGGRIFRGGPPPREMPMNYPPYEYEFDRRPPPPLQRGGGGRGRPRFRGRGRGWFRGRGGNRSRENSRPEVKDEGEEHHEEENVGEHNS